MNGLNDGSSPGSMGEDCDVLQQSLIVEASPVLLASYHHPKLTASPWEQHFFGGKSSWFKPRLSQGLRQLVDFSPIFFHRVCSTKLLAMASSSHSMPFPIPQSRMVWKCGLMAILEGDPSRKCTVFTLWHTMPGWWLGHPSEKYERQLGWLETQY